MTVPPVVPINPIKTQQNKHEHIQFNAPRKTSKPAPVQVTTPFGHATYETIPAETASLLKTIYNLVLALRPFIPQEKRQSTFPKQASVLSPEKPFKAFKEGLVNLKEGLEVEVKKPSVPPPLAKELTPILTKIPVLVKQIQQIIQEVPKQVNPKPEERPPATPLKKPIAERPLEIVPPEEATIKVKGKALERQVQEIEKNIPVFVDSLKKVLVKFPELPPEIKEVLKQFVERLPTQAFAPLEVPKEMFVVAQEGIQKAPIPLEEGVLLPKPAPGKPVPILITERQPEVIFITYPHYIPKLKQAQLALPGVIPKITLQLPVIVGPFIFPRLESLMQRQENISTEIPFAFIVPYTAAIPIHDVPKKEKTPIQDPKKAIEVNDDDEAGEEMDKKVHIFSYIPRGDSLYGDPFEEGMQEEQPLRSVKVNSFAIGVYLVTNQQFVDYLTRQAKKKALQIKERGQVFQDGVLLCQTKDGSSFSDIETEKKKDYVGFKVSSGKESYPVVCVTYFGAKAFCKESGFRLPTEVEWERAAGVKMNDKNEVACKFRFGFARNDITLSCANYGKAPSASLETSTTPVGFYNGTTVLTREGVNLQTLNAESPFGCYDMSGNVWEWTETNQDDLKIIKGGCFQSPSDELRVSARKKKNPGELDGMTGFRVALS
jgi:formylglycine-generating enzyme required for sulfatase activity